MGSIKLLTRAEKLRRKAIFMIKHYITKYTENDKRYAEAWLQLNIFGWCFCFSKRKIELS